ncbi:Phosphoribosylanthranilate isomerase [Rubellimicrobium mesophilum DSM 19309]|uniref:N-(5'-phosphoribosyl)anthranilate isomerase n=1 Tax=Rubellimicrobium mesophilum DSM 19309 TaxID=442562 RepID=A0A017HBQ6_9RHOB|nr:phosphoribosylanthranilate isomerase [Rubellimicrobium mesophilum]EYD71538.1 Phosphoribosylanthranilate isomerase [Rubellimicrobium mesophilum DSM 19309]
MGLRVMLSGRAPVRFKVCGLTAGDQVEAAAEAGAGYVGFVFFPRSPRTVGVERARELAWAAPVGVAKVGLFVDATDEELGAVIDRVPLDMVQLHGREGPERVAEVRARWGLPVMKAVGVGGAADLDRAKDYEGAADQLLLDAKAPAGAALPGGNGVAFDWGLLRGFSARVPWMLAGGLSPSNVAEAVRVSGARQVDVSSGVESAPGVKDAGLIRAFAEALTA